MIIRRRLALAFIASIIITPAVSAADRLEADRLQKALMIYAGSAVTVEPVSDHYAAKLDLQAYFTNFTALKSEKKATREHSSVSFEMRDLGNGKWAVTGGALPRLHLKTLAGLSIDLNAPSFAFEGVFDEAAGTFVSQHASADLIELIIVGTHGQETGGEPVRLQSRAFRYARNDSSNPGDQREVETSIEFAGLELTRPVAPSVLPQWLPSRTSAETASFAIKVKDLARGSLTSLLAGIYRGPEEPQITSGAEKPGFAPTFGKLELSTNFSRAEFKVLDGYVMAGKFAHDVTIDAGSPDDAIRQTFSASGMTADFRELPPVYTQLFPNTLKFDFVTKGIDPRELFVSRRSSVAQSAGTALEMPDGSRSSPAGSVQRLEIENYFAQCAINTISLSGFIDQPLDIDPAYELDVRMKGIEETVSTLALAGDFPSTFTSLVLHQLNKDAKLETDGGSYWKLAKPYGSRITVNGKDFSLEEIFQNQSILRSMAPEIESALPDQE